MTGDQLKQLENNLWQAADQLRANSKLTATEYSFPVLGLIFLRHAYSRFIDAKSKIEENLPYHPQRGYRTLTKDDFLQAKAIFLPEKARWEYIASLPEGGDIGESLDNAMRSIEEDYEVLQGVLPKNYTIFEKDLLHKLIRIFNTELLDDVAGDVFGRIYEYFLNKFAMTGAQEGGEFFTPPSLVNTIVNIIEPDHGIVLDPACGSAGMFVQTGHFIEVEGFNPANKVTFYGQEKADTNTRLAKMNVTVHGLDANIIQGNTFYEDQHDLVSKADFVMANPPFNVDGVDKSKDSVKKDNRLPFGLPKNDNANYLWIQYFYGYLNPTGRAGFVMASSAPDAGHSEKDIRQKIVETGAVDVMVSIGTKFFYTRSLPCTLWFFDRQKEQDEVRKDQTLMLDLREVYRKVSSHLNDFTPEHLKNIAAIVKLYRGDNQYLTTLVAKYIGHYYSLCSPLANEMQNLAKGVDELLDTLSTYGRKSNGLSDVIDQYILRYKEEHTANFDSLKQFASQLLTDEKRFDIKGASYEMLKKTNEYFESNPDQNRKLRKEIRRTLENNFKHLQNMLTELVKEYELNKNGEWRKLEINDRVKELEALKDKISEQFKQFAYYRGEASWLFTRFPEGIYANMPGLCKIVTRNEIADNDYSLSPGRYVGVAPQDDGDFDYEERMAEIKMELHSLNDEAIQLAQTIQDNLNELGL